MKHACHIPYPLVFIPAGADSPWRQLRHIIRVFGCFMFVFRFRFLTIVNLITFFVFANISIFQAGEPAAASASLGREENYAWLEAQQIQGYGFRVRGLKKGEIEMELAAMAHNIARMAG